MQVGEVMTRSCSIVDSNESLEKAAKIMREENIGVLPVAENDKLVGMITDRDIVTRGLAEGKGGKARVREAMTANVKYCFEDEDLDHTLENMAEIQLRRLPVVNRKKRLAGIVDTGGRRALLFARRRGRGLLRRGRPGRINRARLAGLTPGVVIAASALPGSALYFSLGRAAGGEVHARQVISRQTVGHDGDGRRFAGYEKK